MKNQKFKCQKCAGCCTINGYVYVPAKEIGPIAKHLGITKEEFKKKYTRISDNRIVLKGTFRGSCPFLEKKKCTIYSVRPSQCKTFPYWPENMNKKGWKEISGYCKAA